MTKQKISAALLAGLILMCLAGCAEHKTPADPTFGSMAAADVISDTESNDDITAKPTAPTESLPDKEIAPETGLPTEKEENQPEKSFSPDVQTEIPRSSETQPEQTIPPKVNEPALTEPVQQPQTKKPKPTESEKPSQPVSAEPPVTETPKPEPPKPTEPKPEYTQADYDRIIRETKKYAESYAKKRLCLRVERLDGVRLGCRIYGNAEN